MEKHQIDTSTNQDKEEPLLDYDNEIKRLTYEWLAAELSARTEETEKETSKQALRERKWKLIMGKWVAYIAAGLPILFLGVLAWQIFSPCSAFNRLDALPQAVLISASFLSFIVIYAVLIKGMFQHTQESNKDSDSTEKITNIMRQFMPK